MPIFRLGRRLIEHPSPRTTHDDELEMAPKVSHIPRSPRIPAELFQPIFSYITDLHTLFNLSRTNRFLQYDAEKRLYSSISSQHSEDVSLHIGFLRTITKGTERCRRLAGYVREYSIDSILHYHENPLWHLLYAGLRRMVNLKALNVRTLGGHPSGELLLGVPFKLTKLIWRNHSDEENMRRILDEQSELRELGLNCRENDDGLFSEEACPKLEVLRGNRYTIEALLPGRRIQKLLWIPELEDLNFGPLTPQRPVEESLKKVKVFSLGGYFNRPSLELFIESLKEVEVLELLGLHPHELSLLKRLPTLKELIFSLRGGSASFPIPLRGREAFVRKLFEDLPNLKCVDVVHEWKKVDDIRYQRWRRGAAEKGKGEEQNPRIPLQTKIVPFFEVKSERFG